MPDANTFRRSSWDRPFEPAPADTFSAADLPPQGSSPAIDLQRHLGQAALRGFYAPATTRSPVNAKRLVIVAASAIVSWAVVFGAGAVLIG